MLQRSKSLGAGSSPEQLCQRTPETRGLHPDPSEKVAMQVSSTATATRGVLVLARRSSAKDFAEPDAVHTLCQTNMEQQTGLCIDRVLAYQGPVSGSMLVRRVVAFRVFSP